MAALSILSGVIARISPETNMMNQLIDAYTWPGPIPKHEDVGMRANDKHQSSDLILLHDLRTGLS